ncbi:MAG: SusD/RagB family nutrient-binding outer membrane lipoprotein [Bacteroidales bacterium]|nr:SusD/RagB family nutrient-binding outer membrane lipoprotein [Bacteroidales bacterium]
MKIFKSTIIALLILIAACDVDYIDNPNNPTIPPTSALFNKAVEELVTHTRDTWFSGRFVLATMQYWQQSEYGEEDRYSYRESMRERWESFYYSLENLRLVIEFNENEKTKTLMADYGPNQGQIACTRIIMAWMFNLMTDTWGDIPYWSYGGKTNKAFQALKQTSELEISKPAYATQAAIYADIMKELDEAAAQIRSAEKGFSQGDIIYNGNADSWAKFANSLRLRIAVKMGNTEQIADAIADGVFTSNDDNAAFTYATTAKNASPMYRAWNVGKRSDFAVSNTLITLLKGANIIETNGGSNLTTNPFLGLTDPRLAEYADPNSNGEYVGMPIAESSAIAATIKWESLPDGNKIINKPDYAPVLMEYAEVCFLQSEINSWDQAWYIKGIQASMDRWGVSSADATTYTAAVPAANQENVITQKYIALYMDGHTAWTEYRRTGYPNILIKPGDHYTVYEPTAGTYHEYTFNTIPSEITNDLPTRMEYPDFESTLNKDNFLAAVKRLSNGNTLISKLIWDKN